MQRGDLMGTLKFHRKQRSVLAREQRHVQLMIVLLQVLHRVFHMVLGSNFLIV